jgi:antibiotic biosynthesis monooxygenase (ABM) superfamily enzyme
LTRLLTHLVARKATDLSDLGRFARVHDDEILKWAASPERLERNEMARSYVQTVMAVRETELWLFEARRTPRARWRLTMEQLARLYPVEAAPETKLGSLLSTPEPSPRWFHPLLVLWRSLFLRIPSSQA